MIPILWRYAIANYLKVFSLSVGTFISVLLVLRFKEMARFLALSSNGLKTGLFIVYQIPTILPMAIPLSALIASLLLFQRLSRSQELTALRASGISLRTTLLPLCFLSLFFSLFNFSICSELAPFCRRETKTLLYRETSANPLLLLQRQQLIRIRDAYVKLEVEEEGKRASHFMLIAENESNQRLGLITAEELVVQNEELLGRQVAIVSHLNSDDAFDPLILENQASMSTAAPLLSSALKKSRPRLQTNTLGLSQLRYHSREKTSLSKAARIEVLRRISLSLAVFSFTFLGCSFGIEQGRNSSRRGMFYALFLTLAVLISYLFGKTLKSHLLLAYFAFSFPHVLIWLSCLHRLRRISRGLL